MKRKIFSFTALLTLVLFTTTSCNKQDRLQFLNYGGIVFQTIEEDQTYLEPYVAFITSAPMTDGSIVYKGSPAMGRMVGDNIYEITSIICYDLSELTGAYHLKASDAENTIEADFSISVGNGKLFTERMEVSDFEYKENKLIAKFTTLDNADAYGFYIIPVKDGKQFPRISASDKYSTKKAGDIQEVELSFSSAFIYDSVIIRPAVISNSDKTPVVMLGEGKIVEKGGTSFKE